MNNNEWDPGRGHFQDCMKCIPCKPTHGHDLTWRTKSTRPSCFLRGRRQTAPIYERSSLTFGYLVIVTTFVTMLKERCPRFFVFSSCGCGTRLEKGANKSRGARLLSKMLSKMGVPKTHNWQMGASLSPPLLGCLCLPLLELLQRKQHTQEIWSSAALKIESFVALVSSARLLYL